MRVSIPVTAVLAALSISACSAPDAGMGGGESDLATEDQRASYAIGFDLGTNLEPGADLVDLDALISGLRDGMGGSEADIDAEARNMAVQAFGQRLMELQTTAQEAVAAENLALGQEFLAENAEREGVVVTESGLQYEVLEEGEGATPTAEDEVVVHYRGTLIDGTEFDGNFGGDPATFPAGGLITGFSEALMMMREGARWRVVIPADLAYGPQQRGELIAPNSVLIFEIELLEIV